MIKIKKMEVRKRFEFDCLEHNAVLKCKAKDLHPTYDRTALKYKCPICGKSHSVKAYKLRTMTFFRHDVPNDDKDLPVNKRKIKKGIKKEKESRIVQEALRKFDEGLKERERKNESDLELEAYYNDEINKALDEMTKNLNEISKVLGELGLEDTHNPNSETDGPPVDNLIELRERINQELNDIDEILEEKSLNKLDDDLQE